MFRLESSVRWVEYFLLAFWFLFNRCFCSMFSKLPSPSAGDLFKVLWPIG